MRISLKLSLLTAASACLPALLAGLSSVPKAAEAVSTNLDTLRAQEARALAASVQEELRGKLEQLELAARALGAAAPPAQAEEGRVLELLLRTMEGATAVGLFDRSGAAVVPILGKPRGPELFAHAPVAKALEQGSALAPPLDEKEEPLALLAAATFGTPARIVVVELSLWSIARRLEQFREPTFDGNDLSFRARGGAWLIGPHAPEPAGGGASAPVPLLGYRVAVSEPEGARAAVLRTLRGRALLFGALGLACALLAGLLAARRELTPLLQLRDAALQISSGARDIQVDTKGPEELAGLLQGFNEMSRSLQLREELGAGLAGGGRRSLAELLQLSLVQLRRVVPFDRASALFRRAGQLDLVSELGYASHDEARRLAPRDGAVGQALHHRTSTLSEDGSLLVLPLIERGQILGAVALEGTSPFRLEQARVASSFLGPATRLLGSARLFDEVQLSSTHDRLTTLFNRRHFLRLARQLYDTAHRFTQPLSAILVDIEHLRAVNEAHGHAVGDEVLREVAARCRKALRDIHLIGRYGGEEFAILLPMTPRSAALRLLPLLESAVAERPISTTAGALQITVSAGAASTAQGTRSVGDLLRLAGAALAEARRAARG